MTILNMGILQIFAPAVRNNYTHRERKFFPMTVFFTLSNRKQLKMPIFQDNISRQAEEKSASDSWYSLC